MGPVKKDRYVGMFYFITNNNPDADGPLDVTKMIKTNPDQPGFTSGNYYWGEPENGYYLSYDKFLFINSIFN